ncbi:hypothetical protein GINT2_001240 [Glugoides intestinalis]
MFMSTVLLDRNGFISVPKHCIVLGAHISNHPRYFGSKFIVIKPTRKLHEYEDDIERGIFIKEEVHAEYDCFVRDMYNYPDFSTQIVGVSISGALLFLLFKLFG